MRRRAQGVTLIELMIALVVVAVLAAIAVPSYRSYVLRTHRTDAVAGLLAIQSAQEKHFVQYSRYAEALEPPPPAGLGLQSLSEQGSYTLELAVVDNDATPPTFVARATPRADTGQSQDTLCQVFTLDQNGLKRALDANDVDRTADCWR